MLSEAEQRRLTEIETRLRADDPAFAQRFGAEGRRRARPRWHRVAVPLTVALAAVGTVAGLLVRSVGMVVVALTVVGAGSGVWLMDRRRP